MENKKAIVLNIKNLTKYYGTRKAVDNISMQVLAGQIYGFIGPNGAGKSTTIKMITGLAKITSGDIFICGNSISYKFEKAIENIGAIVENPDMYDYLSGLENLKFYAKLYSHKITDIQINNIVKLVGLENRIKDKVKHYSLGMKQRLGIAQALLNSPKLIILDEPTNGLDVNGIIEMRKLLKNLAHKSNVAILVSSHILSEMEALCDEIAIINNGKIVDIKTKDQIKLSNEQKIKYYLETNFNNYAGKLLKQEFKIEDIKLNTETKQLIFHCDKQILSKIVAFLITKKINIYGLGKVELSLEDEFLNIVNANNTNTSIK